MTDIELAEKVCTNCGETKPLSEYHRNKQARDGLHYQCKVCLRQKSREWNAAERERMGDEQWRAYVAEKVRRSRRNNPAVLDRTRRHAAAYRAALRKLRGAHRAEFDKLLEIEKYERGLR